MKSPEGSPRGTARALCVAAALAVSIPAQIHPTMRTTGRVSGFAVDVLDQPVPGARVEIRDNAFGKVFGTTHTDGSGAFVCDKLPFGELMLVVTTPERRGARPVWVTHTEPATDGQLCVLYEGEPVAGRVVDGEGTPVADAEIVVNRDVSLLARTTTDAAGRYRFEHVPLGDSTMLVFASGYRMVEHAITVDAPVELDVPLRRGGATLRIRIDKGRAPSLRTVRSFQVWLGREGMVTLQCLPPRLRDRTFDQDGTCTIDGLLAGEYRVQVWSRELGFSKSYSSVPVAEGEVQDLVVERPAVELAAPVELRGVLVDREDDPVPGLAVRVNDEVVTTDAEGRFGMSEPIAVGSVPTIEVLDATWRTAKSAAGPERVSADGTYRVQVEPAAVVAGRVLTADGRPAAGAQVNLVGEGGRWLTGLVNADLAGRFRFTGVAPTEEAAAVEVSAFLGGGRWQGQGRVAVGALTPHATIDDVELVLDPTGSVAGTLRDGQRPLVGVEIELLSTEGSSVTGSTDRRGRFRVAGLTPGEYRVRATAGTDRSRTRADLGTINVEAGSTTRLDARAR